MMKGRIKGHENINKVSRIGFIKCGEKIKDGEKEYAKSLDYFKAFGDYAQMFHRVFGNQPAIIQVLFLSDNIEDVCYERYEIWQGKKRWGMGNGEYFSIWDEKSQKYISVTIDNYQGRTEEEKLDSFFRETEALVNGTKTNKKYTITWQLVLTIRFLIPRVGGVIGNWELTTRGGKSSIKNVISAFDMVQNYGGTVTRTLFDLRVEKVTSCGMGSMSTYPVLSLIPNMSPENLEKQKNFLSKGMPLPLLITADVIQDIESKQIEYKENKNEASHKNKEEAIETKQENKIIDADYSLFSEPDTDNVKKLREMYMSCKNYAEINRMLKEQQSMNLSESEQERADIIRSEVVEGLRDRQKTAK